MQEEHTLAPLAGDRFDEWYSLYPRKKAPREARKAWNALHPSDDLQATLIDALTEQLPELTARPPDKRPYPASWIRGEHWKNEPDRPTVAMSAPVARSRAELYRKLQWAERCLHDPKCMSYACCIDRLLLERPWEGNT
ncbi:MAG: hypothetical protein WC655_23605 [Candidatus Hydrogenedentales bacterium]